MKQKTYSHAVAIFFLFPIFIFSSLILSDFAFAQNNDPTATVSQNGGDWVNEETVTISWNSTNFGQDNVMTSLSLYNINTGQSFPLWSSGLPLGNYRSGSKSFKVLISGDEATIRLSNQSTGGTEGVPTGRYRVNVSIVNAIINAQKEAFGQTNPFNIVPNVPCLVKASSNGGGGTVTANPTSLPPGGQTSTISYTPVSGGRATSYLYRIGQGSWQSRTLSGEGPGSFQSPACPAPSATSPGGETIHILVSFQTPPKCLLSANPATGGTVTLNPTNGQLAGGQSGSIRATANTNWKVKNFLFNSQEETSARGKQTYTKNFSCPATGGQNFSATITFASPCTLNVSSPNPEGGTITPGVGSHPIPANGSTKLSVNAKNGWLITSVMTGGYPNPLPANRKSFNKNIACGLEGRTVPAVVTFEQQVQWTVTTSIESDQPAIRGKVVGQIRPLPLGKKTYYTAQTQKFEVIPNTALGYEVEWVKLDGKIIQPDSDGKYSVDYDANKKDRNLRARFMLGCHSYTPQRTINDMMARPPRPTYINRPSFRQWAIENKDLVIQAMAAKQCVPQIWFGNNIDYDQIISNYKATDRAPLVGGYVGRNSTESWAHAIVILDLEYPVYFPDGEKGAILTHIDSNGPSISNLYCWEYASIDGTQLYTDCSGNSPSIFMDDDNALEMILFKTDRNFNDMILSGPIVRSEPSRWLAKNYTPFINDGGPYLSDGICQGWSEFNVIAATRVRECPLESKGSMVWLRAQIASVTNILSPLLARWGW
jgi:hypothetical protein